MRILHYLHGLPPVRNGGLVKYALDLAEGQRKAGNEVHLLVPGSFESPWSNRKTRVAAGSWKNIRCHFIINPLLVTEGMRIERMDRLMEQGDTAVYITFLKKLCPDVIHVHSLMGIHLAFFHAAESLSVPVIFTTHDYYGLCPKVNLLRNGKICDRKDWKLCAQCMGAPVSEKKQERKHSPCYRRMKKSRFYQWLEYAPGLLPYKSWIRGQVKGRKVKSGGIEKEETVDRDGLESHDALRVYYLEIFRKITCFHFNSRQAYEVYHSFLGEIKGEVLPITNKSVADHRRIRTYTGKLKIGYLSQGKEFKGYPKLLEALDAMYQTGRTEFECHIYFNLQERNHPYLRQHAPYREKELKGVFDNMDILVAPGIWKETFGMVVPEALSYGVPVILSSHVGAKELLEGNPGMGVVLDVGKLKEQLQEMLEKLYDDREILARMNERICRWKWDWNYDTHVRAVMHMYEKAVSRDGMDYL